MSAAATREVYALVDESGTVRYVGQSANARVRTGKHRWDALHNLADGRPVAAWLRSLDATPTVRVLATVDAADAVTVENRWIRQLRRDPAAQLLNLRPYEDLAGLPGVDPAAEARMRWSLARVPSAQPRARVSAVLRGHRVSAETRRRIGLATRGRPKSPAHRAAISAGVMTWHARRRLKEARVDAR
ncbi:hypothetical protein [Streptomyces mirabilis]